MDRFNAVRFAVVAALPTASANTGRVLEQGGKLWFSDGTNWLDLSYTGTVTVPTMTSISTDYTFVLGDANKPFLHPSADTTARAWTIPANASVAYPTNTIIDVYNGNGAGDLNIFITTDTLRQWGTGKTGAVTLKANGKVRLIKISATEWWAIDYNNLASYYTPATIFGAGDQGWWLDISDISSMFQDAAGTTAAAVGSPVGKITDKSGKGNHFTQTTTAQKPILRLDSNSRYYLECDGVDDNEVTGNINLNAFTKMATVAGYRLEGTTSQQLVLANGYSAAQANGGFQMGHHTAFAGNLPFYGALYQNNTTNNTTVQNASPGAPPRVMVSTCLMDWVATPQSAQITLRNNAATSTQTLSGVAVTGAFAFTTITLAARSDLAIPLQGRIYNLVSITRVLTTQELTDLETFVNSKTGAY